MLRLFLLHILILNFLNVLIVFPISGKLIGQFIAIEQNINQNNFWKTLGDIAEDAAEETTETKSLQPSRKRIALRQVFGSGLLVNVLKSPSIDFQAIQRLFYINQIIPKPEYILFLFRLTPF
ncbi:MAG: hypothetical protein MUE85_00030 [Microscillaceae bacterium]|nr:hypothetical protein [Microscillaceae bacterium]